MKTNIAPRFAALAAALALTLWLASQQPATAAFSSGAQPPVGKECVIQFRRGDALGGAGNLPVSPTTGGINGAEVALSGILRSITPEWIALERKETTLWIPKESVLLIQTSR